LVAESRAQKKEIVNNLFEGTYEFQRKDLFNEKDAEGEGGYS